MLICSWGRKVNVLQKVLALNGPACQECLGTIHDLSIWDFHQILTPNWAQSRYSNGPGVRPIFVIHTVLMESYAVGYALEGSSMTSFEKERFHHLWWSLLGISPCLLKAGPHDVGLAVSAVQGLNQHLWHVWTLSSAPKITSFLQIRLTLNF